MTMPGTTIYTGRGDVTLAWDDGDDPQIIAMIEAKTDRQSSVSAR